MISGEWTFTKLSVVFPIDSMFIQIFFLVLCGKHDDNDKRYCENIGNKFRTHSFASAIFVAHVTTDRYALRSPTPWPIKYAATTLTVRIPAATAIAFCGSSSIALRIVFLVISSTASDFLLFAHVWACSTISDSFFITVSFQRKKREPTIPLFHRLSILLLVEECFSVFKCHRYKSCTIMLGQLFVHPTNRAGDSALPSCVVANSSHSSDANDSRSNSDRNLDVRAKLLLGFLFTHNVLLS
ncbi:MAG: hypothetical protein [Chaetfec virus UA24_144]|nr:MAG: hypothetical protein [Chaetfec virus UA24_144]